MVTPEHDDEAADADEEDTGEGLKTSTQLSSNTYDKPRSRNAAVTITCLK
jgi:hypothetical protein